MLDLTVSSQLMAALTPDIVLITGAMVLMIYAAMRPESAAHQRNVGIGAMALLVLTIFIVVVMAMRGDVATTGVIAVDQLRWMIDLVVLLAALGTVALSIEHNTKQGVHHGEMHVLVLFATLGMMILAAARDMMVLFLGIEIMSVAVYVLVGMNRRSPRAAEASLKYFLLGAFATAFLLYGMALIYGATGATQFTQIARAVLVFQLGAHPMLLVGVGLLTIGFLFKVAAAPFHMWAPDVYEGAPTPITAFMSSAVKAAAFAGFIRLWYESFSLVSSWPTVIWWVAIISMIVGNVIALRQTDIKRMLAYSSIVHSGYLLVTLLTVQEVAATALLFYVFAYTLATFGAFAVIDVLQGTGARGVKVNDFAGLWQTRPALAVAMSVYLLSMLGFPVFGGIGFFGKWYLLGAALSSPLGLKVLAVILVVTSVISAAYYLQVVRVMFMQPRAEGAEPFPVAGPLTKSVLVVTTIAILFFGILPGSVADWAQGGAQRETATDAPVPVATAPGN